MERKEPLETLIPELKESEDENNLQKKHKEFLKNRDSFMKNLETIINQYGIDTFTDTPDFILADFLWRIIEQIENLNDKKNWWSGKKTPNLQSEQNPIDKVEPKFKVGDFVVNDYCLGKVIELTDDAYLLDTGQGIPFSCEHNAHLWTIDDAKDGDVLAYPVDDKNIYLFKEQRGSTNIANAHFQIFNRNNELRLMVDKAADFNLNTKPATKEQRELLFQKMKEAGYEWDAEKKELKKIENNTTIVKH